MVYWIVQVVEYCQRITSLDRQLCDNDVLNILSAIVERNADDAVIVLDLSRFLPFI